MTVLTALRAVRFLDVSVIVLSYIHASKRARFLASSPREFNRTYHCNRTGTDLPETRKKRTYCKDVLELCKLSLVTWWGRLSLSTIGFLHVKLSKLQSCVYLTHSLVQRTCYECETWSLAPLKGYRWSFKTTCSGEMDLRTMKKQEKDKYDEELHEQ
jgi:hypothetical protein